MPDTSAPFATGLILHTFQEDAIGPGKDVFDVPADVVIVAIGNSPNPLLPGTESQLEKTRWGTLAVDETTGRTTMAGVFAGGDIVTGGATVILAMGAGRTAADAIHRYLSEG